MAKIFWVYILECSNGNLYAGYTVNLEKRFQEHLSGSPKCKYTRSFKPLGIAQSWQTTSKSVALKAEKYIKGLTKAKKLELILKPDMLAEIYGGVISEPF